ncbi:MAG TPA: hypothetical protein VKM55_00300, partial [Candidatus Lokiarchaeia archaeon]|nr:hypothetical protein [Candidatus Lokiarchaeia archaeon]
AKATAEALNPPFSKARATRAQRDQTLARPRGASARARPAQRVTRLVRISFGKRMGVMAWKNVSSTTNRWTRGVKTQPNFYFFMFIHLIARSSINGVRGREWRANIIR